MKEKQFPKILLLFDYFKVGYRILQSHKSLYKPQLIYMVIQLLSTGLFLLSLIMAAQNGVLMYAKNDFAWSDFLALFMGPFVTLCLVLLVSTIGRLILEAGMYNMYNHAIMDTLTPASFTIGVGKYFFSFLLGEVLIGLLWIVGALPYFLLGIMTLSIGFAIVPLLVSTLLAFWKIAIVYDHSDVQSGLKSSFKFSKKHFAPVFILCMIQNAFLFTFSASFLGSGNMNYFNFKTYSDIFNPTFFENPIPTEGLYTLITWLGFGLSLIILIASTIGFLFQMVFRTFFALVLNWTYMQQFKLPDTTEPNIQPLPVKEVQTDDQL